MFEIREPSPMRHSRTQDDIQMENSQKQCGICNQRLKNSQFSTLCTCEHEFCLDCLKYFTMHKIRNEFSVIGCPKENCKSTINEMSQTYQNLPENLKQRYNKIIQNLKQLSNPSYRICPRCEETQLNQLKGQDNLFCKKCLIKYCKICLNPAHKKYAKCDNAVASILKGNFQFKRCSNCMFLVEKNEGCNHMTCMCKHQFCYLCGGNWNNGNHECPPRRVYVRPRSVRLIKRQIPQRRVLALVPINLGFNPEENQSSWAKGAHQDKYRRFFPSIDKKSKQRRQLSIGNNSLVINNVSVPRIAQNQN